MTLKSGSWHRFRPVGLASGSVFALTLATSAAISQERRSQENWATTQKVQPLVDRLFDDEARKRGLDEKTREAYRARGAKLVTDYLRKKEAMWGPVLGEFLAQAGEQDGWWPKPRVLNLIVERTIDTAVGRYDLDDRQRAVLTRWATERIPPLMEERRKEIEPLVSDLLLQYASGKPPDAKKIQDWSSRLLPLTREFKALYDEGYRKMLPHLHPEQRSKWGQDYFQVTLGHTMLEAKLRSYAKGGYDPRAWRPTAVNPNLGPQEYVQLAEKSGMDTTTPPHIENPIIAAMSTETVGPDARRDPNDPAGHDGPDDSQGGRYVPLDKWQSYTREFIRRHHLNEGQKTAAMAILKEVRERAGAHDKRHQAEMGRLKKSIQRASGQAKANLCAELAELERPLHDLFEEFRGRLDQLLDETQR